MEKFIVITGAPGSGKSRILHELNQMGYTCVDEPARQILSEQRKIEGDGIPERSPRLFTDLLLSRATFQYKQMLTHQGPVFFDRGIPDNVAYATLFDIDEKTLWNAGREYLYNKRVFFTPSWEEIYEMDDERKMSFDEASQFGDYFKRVYTELAYDLIEVPREDPKTRAEFIAKTYLASAGDL
ncbi:MAG: putative ATPase [Chlamydiales bacterium]|jgi:predicted ATPase